MVLRQAGGHDQPYSAIAGVAPRDFRYLWLAQSASVIGDCIVLVALGLFVIDLTGSATDLGLVLAAQSVPLVAFLLIGGVWADRLPRHRLMIATDLVRFTLHAALAFLIFSGSVQVWYLIVIEALFGTAEAFFRQRPSEAALQKARIARRAGTTTPVASLSGREIRRHAG